VAPGVLFVVGVAVFEDGVEDADEFVRELASGGLLVWGPGLCAS
jgi:hypothetical protein